MADVRVAAGRSTPSALRRPRGPRASWSWRWARAAERSVGRARAALVVAVPISWRHAGRGQLSGVDTTDPRREDRMERGSLPYVFGPHSDERRIEVWSTYQLQFGGH